MPRRRTSLLMAMLATAPALAAGPAPGQEGDRYPRAGSGTRTLALPGGTTVKVLLESANLGSDAVEVAEIVFPVGTNPPVAHRHRATEIFYVVEGVLEHVVNGTAHRLEPGMVGVVRPGDEVTHRVASDVPVKALALWVPGDEADQIAPEARWSRLGG
jgi:mannose-6-phosphate isomerase-like protein (cupin superfamily)